MRQLAKLSIAWHVPIEFIHPVDIADETCILSVQTVCVVTDMSEYVLARLASPSAGQELWGLGLKKSLCGPM